MQKHSKEVVARILHLKDEGLSHRQIAKIIFGRKSAKSTVSDIVRANTISESVIKTGPRILILDIETSPILANVWSLWNNNVSLNQIHKDWFILSYSAKWYGEDEIFYNDQRNSPVLEDDHKLLSEIWDLLDACDWLVTQNGIKFDTKKINARFALNGFKPPSSYNNIDTFQIAKSIFGFTSNKLEYMTDKLCTKYKKLSHGKFPGFELWKQCMAGNLEAFEEMEKYNKYDVLSLEELYTVLRAWDKKHPNPNLYSSCEVRKCRCGSNEVEPYGFVYTNLSKFQRFRCKSCGAESRGRTNLLSREDKNNILVNVV